VPDKTYKVDETYKVLQAQRVCPYCKKRQTVLYIKIHSKDLTLFLCTSCCAISRVLPSGELIKLRSIRKAETDETCLLCTECYTKMVPNYETWLVECPDPICNFTRLIPGLSQKDRELKKQFQAQKSDLYERLALGEEVPQEELENLKRLGAEVRELKENPWPTR